MALQFTFGRCARLLAAKDPSLQDDLIQEMSLAVLECREDGSRDFFRQRAFDRALNFLKYERLRGFIPLDEIDEPRGVPREIPDELLVQALLRACKEIN